MKKRRRFVVTSRMKNGVERLELLGGGKDGAAHQPFKVRAFGHKRVECPERLGDRLGLAIVLGE